MRTTGQRIPVRGTRCAVLVLALLGADSEAIAGDLTLLLKPSYRAHTTTTRNEAGESRRSAAHELLSRYSVTLNKRLFPLLSVRLTGSLDDRRNLVTLGDGPAPSDSRTSIVAGDMRVGPQAINASAGYARSQRSSFPADGRSTTYVNESATATGELRPPGLPEMRLRVTRSHSYDLERERRDGTALGAQLGLRHDVKPVALRYTLSWTRPSDEIARTETSSLSHRGSVSYGEQVLGGRVRIAAGYSIAAASTRVRRAGPGGLVTTQRYPVAGLSGVSIFPMQPTETALSPNPALVDGDTAASANINLGYGPSLEGDTHPREIGATVADNSDEPVNMVYLWTDRWLPAEVAGMFAWTAYTSDDNVRWQPLAVTGPALFATFHNRFEIGIEATTARHLKLVATPLSTTATTDETFADIFVTELQLFEALPASDLETSHTTASSNLNASASTRLHAREALHHQLSVGVRRRHLPTEDTAYTLSNTLTYSRRVDIVMLASQLTRQDSGDGDRHRTAWTWGASAATRPLDTLHHSLAYSGQYRSAEHTAETTNNVSLTNRAKLYRGVSVMANVGYRRATTNHGDRSASRQAAASASLTPHRILSLHGTYAYTHTAKSTPASGDVREASSHATASASARPLPTLSLSASVTAYHRPHATDRVLASYGGTFSPLRGGLLSISGSYGETLDFAADGISRRGFAQLRWKVRPGWFAAGSYTYLASISQAVDTRTHVAMATLTGQL